MSKKDFKFTIRNYKGLIIHESIVAFGSDEQPFPHDWENDGRAIRSLNNYKEDLLNEKFSVDVSDDTTLTLNETSTTGNIISTLMNHMKNIQNTTNPLSNEFMEMDLSDIGNAIGIEIQKAIQNDRGDMNDFMNGLNHGISTIDGTHDNKDLTQFDQLFCITAKQNIQPKK